MMNPAIASWSGKRVWIVGASTGIGLETARLLRARGAKVAVSARRAEALDAFVAEMPEVGALALPVDVGDVDALARASAALRERWGGIDLVLVSAGAYDAMRAHRFDLARARHVIEVNLFGPLNVLDAVLPVLLAQGQGGFGVISSVAGYRGLPRALAYGPSKAAVINLCESLYFDLRPRGIGVYLVSPGFVETPMTAGNEFPMPGLISAAEAARQLVRGLERGEFEIRFPRGFTSVLKWLRILPYRAYFWLVHRATGL